MIRKIPFLFLALTLILSACQAQTVESNPTEAEDQSSEISMDAEAFELYLVADPQITGPDLPFYDLEDLPLDEQPIITTQDLIWYNWEYHSFELKEEIYAQVIALFSQHVPMSGLPFVLLSNGERIYAGAFWSPASSLHFGGVVIMHPFDPTGGPLSITLGYPDESYFMGEDPRSDPRLKEALEAVGLLE
ncbi:MAG: hypothetical protein ACK2TV_07785 [Anaerolineales bacterium]